METAYDWISLAIFAGIIVLFLQRSSMENPPDRMIDYLPPALGCAMANQAGNYAIENDSIPMHLVGIALLIGVVVYVWLVLKPSFK
ncbi:MAG: hypothetical protein BGP16_07070 [Sphingobium sp. 66-54]|nr:MAG: hypothetical protein BGP16_07070 [Sphingobium sp. 66-54]